MKITMSKIKIIKDIVSAAEKITDETEIIINQKGIILLSTDPGVINILYAIIPKDFFEEFEMEDKILKIPISLSDLKKILDRCSVTDTLNFLFDDNEQILKIISKKKNENKKTFSLRTKNLDIPKVNIKKLSEIEFDNKINFDLSEFIDAIKDSEINDENLNIKIIPGDKISFYNSGVNGNFSYDVKLINLKKYEIKTIQSSTFGIQSLGKISDLKSITDDFYFFLRSDYPLKMIFSIEEKIKVYFFIAPRVDQIE